MIEGQTEENKKCAEKILDRLEKLKAKRSSWESHWQECMQYIVPRKEDVISTRTAGDKRGYELFDTTAIMSNQLLAGALHGMLTNPSVRFFELIVSDPETAAIEEVGAWLQDTGERMYQVLNNTNFQTEIHEIYIDEGSIGTACMFMGEHPESIIHFSARPMKEIFVDENNLGLIDTVHRVFKWKPRQIVQEFGEAKVPPFLMREYQSGCNDEYEIVHSVEKACACAESEGHSCGDEKAKIFPYKSSYVLVEKKFTLSEAGFREFPYAVPRWTKTSGEIYGRGPGMEMLADIKMVNAMMETTLNGAQKSVNPPLLVPDESVIGKVRLTPGGLTIVRPGEQYNIKPLIIDARVDFGYQAVEDVRKRIRAGFYVDQLQLNDGPQMTATEVMQRTEEKLRLMGPVLGRQHFEFLRPVIDRLFGVMYRRGMFKPAPPQLKGKKFDVRYSSLVARAQRMSDGQNLSRAIGVAAPIINAKPETMDLLNADEALRYIFEVYGVPHRLFATQKQLKDTRDARAEAAQKAAEEKQMMNQAEMAGKAMPGMAQMAQAQTQAKAQQQE